MTEQIPLTIDPNVVPDWNLWEAFREVLQGAIDASPSDYRVSYNQDSSTLIISNPGQLGKETLLIGHSTKRDDSSKIGQHGEGYKLAAAVLLRLGKSFRIYNNSMVWNFRIKYNRKFSTDLVHLISSSWFVKNTGTVLWEIGNVSKEEYDMLAGKVQHGGDLQVENGYILLDQPGKIYSGDLYVCDMKDLEYGYNFNPGILALQRDRNLISDFDIIWETSKMWLEQPDLPGMIKDNVADVRYATANESTADQAYKLFKAEHGSNAIPCASEEDKIAGAENIIVAQIFRDAISKSPIFREEILAKVVELDMSPHEQLKQWYEGFKSEYGFTVDRFEKILERSKNWEVGG